MAMIEFPTKHSNARHSGDMTKIELSQKKTASVKQPLDIAM